MDGHFQPLKIIVFSALIGDLIKTINQTPVEDVAGKFEIKKIEDLANLENLKFEKFSAI